MTVVTVTPNPALDITYVVDRLRPGDMHRVGSVADRAGGKGLNVARVLARLGTPVAATGLVGGVNGAALRAKLAELTIDDELVNAEIATRRTVTVVDNSTGEATLFNEPGPQVSAQEWDLLHKRVSGLLPTAAVVTMSGSLPPGVSPRRLAELAATVTDAGVPVIVDTSGAALAAAVHARPSLVKPNLDELREVTGVDDPLRAAAALRAETGGAVVVSLGPDGLLAVTPHGSWSAQLPEPLAGNPTGAGDSVVAALAMCLRDNLSWPELLREACALSAATVLAPVAGEYDAGACARLRPTVDVSEVTT